MKYTNKSINSYIGDLEVEFYPWTGKNERDYLSLVEKCNKEDKEATDKDVLETLIFPVVIKPDIKTLNKLSSEQQKLLLIKIREVSISDEITDDVICPECEKEQVIKEKIKDCISYKPKSFKDVVVQDIQITWNTSPHFNNTKKDEVINSIYNEFLCYVQDVKIGEESYNEPSFKDKKEFFDTLPTKIFDEIFNKYTEMKDELEIRTPFKCKNCEHEDTIIYEHIPNFLWI